MSAKCNQLACMFMLGMAGSMLGQQPATPLGLRENAAVGDQYRVSCRASLQGTMRLPGEGGTAATVLPFSGSSQIDYVERILEVDASGEVRRTLRIYERMDFRRRLGQQEQSSVLRPAARRMVVVRHGHLEVPFSPDGPLLWSEIDRVRTDVFPAALASMLPAQPVKPGDKWLASAAALLELTDLEKITAGQLECQLERLITRENSRLAQIAFQGTVTGVAQDGPTKHQLSGFFYFDLDARLIVYLSLEGKQSLLDSEGKVVSDLQGQFVLTRQRVANLTELSEEALRGLRLVPDEENTRLLFDEPGLGVSFVYPRRWTVRQANTRQVILDEPSGGAVLVVLDEPGRGLSGAQYQQQVEQWLAKEKAVIHRRSAVVAASSATGKLEHFQYEVSLGTERLILDYYAYQHSSGAATIAARVPAHQTKLLDDVAVMVRSLRRSLPVPDGSR